MRREMLGKQEQGFPFQEKLACAVKSSTLYVSPTLPQEEKDDSKSWETLTDGDCIDVDQHGKAHLCLRSLLALCLLGSVDGGLWAISLRSVSHAGWNAHVRRPVVAFPLLICVLLQDPVPVRLYVGQRELSSWPVYWILSFKILCKHHLMDKVITLMYLEFLLLVPPRF